MCFLGQEEQQMPNDEEGDGDDAEVSVQIQMTIVRLLRQYSY